MADKDITDASKPDKVKDSARAPPPSQKLDGTLLTSDPPPKHQIPFLAANLVEHQEPGSNAATTTPEPKQQELAKDLEPDTKQEDIVEELARLQGQNRAPELCGSLPRPMPTQAVPRNSAPPAQPGAFAVPPSGPQTSDSPHPPIHDLPTSDSPESSSTLPFNREGLVEANPVLLEDLERQIPHASPVDATSQKLPSEGNWTNKDPKQAHAILSIVAIVLVAGLVLGLVFGLVDDDKSGTTDLQPLLSSSVAPSMAPTSSFLLEFLPFYSQETIRRDPESAQAKAYEWLLDDPTLGNYTTGRILQRYALATFFFSAGGNTWFLNGNNSRRELTQTRQRPPMKDIPLPTHQYAWLDYFNNSSAVHECDWYNLNYLGGKDTCNDLQEYINLELPNNNLQGSLPRELALLTSMESLALHRNKLRGTIPIELFSSWSKIQVVVLLQNNLSGNIPSELGLWQNNLQSLSLQRNGFSGLLPSEVWQLSRLATFHVRFNALTGSIPTDIGKMESLGSIELEGNDFHSGLPTEISLATSLFRLQFSSESAWTLPSQLARLTKLAYLTLDGANLSGTIPSEIALLSNLKRLSLNDNPLLLGSIPASLGLLPSLLPTNQTPTCPAQGLPMTLPYLPKQELDLEQVSLKGSGLTGSLPVEWCSSLKILCFDCSNSSQSLCGCGCPCPE